MKVKGTSAENIRGPSDSSGASSVSGSRDKRKGGKISDGTESSEKVSISPRAKEAAQAKALAKAAPDVNDEKVARLKAAINSGNYKVDADKIADKMVDEHIATIF